MTSNDTIRLLILNDSRAEAERLISMLRNAGRPSRAQHIESEEVLVKLLQEQTWDLLIAHDKTQSVTPSAAIKLIKRLSKDVPVVLVTDQSENQTVVDGMKLGAADVVRLDEDQHLLLVIERELDSHHQRQLRRRSDRRFKEAERRSQQLLDSSRDAIAYVQDGMYLYVNESFAELFGYSDRDDIECVPIIDMIAEPDQDKVKHFMREFSLRGADGESCSLDFSALGMDGSVYPVSMEIANAIYDEEPCIQFLARARANDNQELEAKINQIKNQDAATGVYNRQYLVNRLQHIVNSSGENHSTSALLTIEVDNFEESIQPEMGMAAADEVLRQIASFIGEHCPTADTLARFGDNAFSVLLSNTHADAALQLGQNLCSELAKKIIEVEQRTVQVTLSAGIALINETASSADLVIEDSLKALHEPRAASSTPGIGNGAKLYEPQISMGDNEDMGRIVRAALSKEQFRLLFQPIISLRGSSDEHYEILLRMVGDDGEEISPFTFMEAASKHGLAGKIDRWVILESLKRLALHRKDGHRTNLLIHLSADSMADSSLLPWLGVAIKAAELPAKAITFQLREADVTNKLKIAKTFFEGLKALGCNHAIINFGCALNPFNALQHVTPDYVKVDGSFTQDIQNNDEGAEALLNMIKQLHELQKITIVPSVEHASVLSTLWQAGVHYIQGHYLQAPQAEMSYDFSMDG